MCLKAYNQLLVLLISVMFKYSLQEVVEKCRDIPLIQNLDMEKLNGTWYPTFAGSSKEASSMCSVAHIAVERKPTGVIIKKVVFSKEKGINTRTHSTPIGSSIERYTLFSVNNTSRFKGQVDNQTKESELKDGWLVSTDYNTYSMWYLCEPGTEDGGIVFGSTRSRPAKKATVDKMLDLFKKLGFKLKSVRIINQRNCND